MLYFEMTSQEQEEPAIAPDRDGVILPEDDPDNVTEAQERESVDLPEPNSVELPEDEDGSN